MAHINEFNFGELEITSSMREEDYMGLIFLAVGLGGILIGLTSSASNSASISFQIFLPSIFALVGLAISFGRRHIYGDKNSRRLSCWWGIGGLGIKSEYDVSQSNLVSVKQETRGSGKNRRTYYVVYVSAICDEEQKPCEAAPLRDYCEARQVGEALSRFLNIPLCDYIAGGGLNRDPETLDWSIRERFTNEGRTPEFPELPNESKIKHVAEGHSHRLILPPRGLCFGTIIESSLFAIGAIFLLPMAVGILYLLNTDKSLPSSISHGGTAIILIAIGLGALRLGRNLWDSINGHCEILVSRDRLVIESHGMLSVSTNEFSAEKIEEVLPAMFAKELLIRSDEQKVSIGSGLDQSDLCFIRGCIEYALCS
jgi:hypothetical protein